MKCMNRDVLEKLLDESPIDSRTFTDGFNPSYFFCCVGQKGTQASLGKYFLAKAYSPHDVCSHIHQHLLPNETLIDGKTNYLDYITVNQQFAEYAVKALDLPNNITWSDEECHPNELRKRFSKTLENNSSV